MRIYNIDEIYTEAISLLKITKMFDLNEHGTIVSNVIYSKMHYDMIPYLVVENEYMLRVNERGNIIIEYKTRDIDDALYWELSQIAWEISCKTIKDDNDWKIQNTNRKDLVEKIFEDIGGRYYSWYKKDRNIFNFDSSEFYKLWLSAKNSN